MRTKNKSLKRSLSFDQINFTHMDSPDLVISLMMLLKLVYDLDLIEIGLSAVTARYSQGPV